MATHDICWMSAVDLAKAIKRRKISPVEVIKTFLERIEAINPKVNAYVTVTADSALAEAKRVGIPVVAVADTNSNPDELDYPIPANDDAIRAVRLVCSKIADAVIEGKALRAPTTKEKPEEETPAETAAPEATQPVTPNPDAQ